MLMRNSYYPHLSYKVINNVAQIINTQLRHDWVIRIEFTDEIEYLNTSWQQWGKAFYNISEPTDIVDNIFACHDNHQHCSIRLYAEKFKPASRFYYPICQACRVSDDCNQF